MNSDRNYFGFRERSQLENEYQNINTMENQSLLKKGTRVMATHRTSIVIPQPGVIQAVDHEDRRTSFPYFVEFEDNRAAWVKESDIKTVLPPRGADNAIKVMVLVIMFLMTCACVKACHDRIANYRTPYNDTPVNGSFGGKQGEIPANNLSDTLS